MHGTNLSGTKKDIVSISTMMKCFENNQCKEALILHNKNNNEIHNDISNLLFIEC